MLGAQDGERSSKVTKEPAAASQTHIAGDLDSGDTRRCRDGTPSPTFVHSPNICEYRVAATSTVFRKHLSTELECFPTTSVTFKSVNPLRFWCGLPSKRLFRFRQEERCEFDGC